MKNQVTLDEATSVIRNVYQGDQNYRTLQAVAEQTLALADKIRQSQRPVLILVDITKIGRTGQGTQQASREIFARLKYDRLAIFGGKPYMAALIKAISSMLTLSNIKHFETAQQAEAWLLG